eukprot:1149177-Pelagomonas_calceolata.AAC.3
MATGAKQFNSTAWRAALGQASQSMIAVECLVINVKQCGWCTHVLICGCQVDLDAQVDLVKIRVDLVKIRVDLDVQVDLNEVLQNIRRILPDRDPVPVVLDVGVFAGAAGSTSDGAGCGCILQVLLPHPQMVLDVSAAGSASDGAGHAAGGPANCHRRGGLPWPSHSMTSNYIAGRVRAGTSDGAGHAAGRLANHHEMMSPPWPFPSMMGMSCTPGHVIQRRLCPSARPCRDGRVPLPCRAMIGVIPWPCNAETTVSLCHVIQ